MSVKKVKVPIFEVFIYLVNDVQDAKDLIQRLSATPDPTVDEIAPWRGFCHSVTDEAGREHRMMCVFDRETTLNTTIHEAVHAAWMMLRYCSMKVRPDSGEEPLAYLTAWFAEEMLTFLRDEGFEVAA